MMIQWQSHKRAADEDAHMANNLLLSPPTVKEELDDEEAFTADSLTSSESGKKRCIPISQLVSSRASKRDRKQSIRFKCKQIKNEESGIGKRKTSVSSRKDNSAERWSLERYKVAEKNMLEVMKAEGAAIDKPISRPVLRAAARKYIGDTGLLDHLLKHIDGKVAPGGAQRFRRCYNTEGIMEYWLENADLVGITRAAGVPAQNWVPPSWSKSSNSTVVDPPTGELAVVKDEIAKMKRNLEELNGKNCSFGANQSKEMNKELIKWKMNIDHRLMEISSSLSSMQETFRELVAWKSKAEQQLVEISNSVNSMIGVSNHGPNFSPSCEKWEDWLEYSTLDPVNDEDFASLLDNPDPINFGRDSNQQGWTKPTDHFCSRELDSLKDDVVKMKRDMQDLIPRRIDDEQAKLTPDSSVTVNSKSDHNDTYFQEMVLDLMKWKAQMEQQMVDISSCLGSLQAAKQQVT